MPFSCLGSFTYNLNLLVDDVISLNFNYAFMLPRETVVGNFYGIEMTTNGGL